jgi:hypothetical protein
VQAMRRHRAIESPATKQGSQTVGRAVLVEEPEDLVRPGFLVGSRAAADWNDSVWRPARRTGEHLSGTRSPRFLTTSRRFTSAGVVTMPGNL